MNYSNFIISIIYKHKVMVLALTSLSILLFYLVKLSSESHLLLRKYHELENEIVYHSSVAEKFQLRGIYQENNGSNENFHERVMTLFNENGIALSTIVLKPIGVLIKVDKIKLATLLDIIIILSNDEGIEVNKVSVNISKDSNYIFGEVVLLPYIKYGKYYG
ncbi:hypothetical protein [Yersinia vastinensis]|uniref:hypothetical protein n=1 Tax=Yersinia vastinensis TaxID=2890318 RepID=UPI0011A016C6|nr:hypothetical protein [Yersinia vastinensis]